MDYLRRSLYRCSHAIPDYFKLAPYRLALSLLRLIVDRVAGTKVWLRNSFALGYWSFALSDLDISVWVDGETVEVAKEWERLKPYRLLLIGGEVQIYSSRTTPHFLPYANPWELRRDPELIKQTQYLLELKDDMTLTVFLVRSIASDRLLRREPALRQRKWKEHLQSFGFSSHNKTVNWDVMVNLLQQRAPFLAYSVAEISEALQATIDPLSEQTPYLHRLLHSNRYVWGFKVGNDDIEFLAGAPQEIHQFLYLQICWEIWGLSPFTLVTQGFSLASLNGHIANQTRLAQMLKISDEQKDFLAAGWARLEKFYQPIQYLD